MAYDPELMSKPTENPQPSPRTEPQQVIDTQAVADLVQIRRDEEVLGERLEKMEASKSSVSEAVYRRVKADYESRRAALENSARAPRERAGREYAKVRELKREAEKALQETRLHKEELEYRHQLGEFEDEPFQIRLADCEKTLSGQQARLDELIALREEFLKAFRSEEDLEKAAAASVSPGHSAAEKAEAKTAQSVGPPVTPPLISQAPPPPVPPSEPPASSQNSVAAAIRAKSSPPPVAAAENRSDFSPEETVVRTVPEQSVIPGRPPESRSATLMMPRARLIVLVDEKPETEYILGEGSTSIGRSADNTIHLPHHDVSRHHATIAPEPDGFKIIDCGSPNGVFVNADRVTEKILADGDVIQLGLRKLLFKF